MATKHISDVEVCVAVVVARHFRHCEFRLNTSLDYPYQVLQVLTSQPEKVCYRAMERAVRRDLIEYGVSLRTGWLTDKGKALLKGQLDEII